MISTHSARGGGDSVLRYENFGPRPISTHSARGGGDPRWPPPSPGCPISTHSARGGGDSSRSPQSWRPSYFNPLRPRGRRLGLPVRQCQRVEISTHSARGGGDFGDEVHFLVHGISTHSARGGGDRQSARTVRRCRNFNPLRPRGRRPRRRRPVRPPAPISTHSARGGGDTMADLKETGQFISTHSARGGGDGRTARRRT